MKKYSINTTSRIALMIAVYVLLNLTIALRIGNWKLTFGSLPVVLSALLFGPAEGAVVAILGEFLTQLLTYGLTPTTVIWIIPPAFRALVIGAIAMRMGRKNRFLDESPTLCYGVCIAASLVTTAGNTGGMILDSLFYRTPLAAVLMVTPLRLFTGVLTAIAVTSAAIPLARVLRSRGIATPGSRGLKVTPSRVSRHLIAKGRR